MVAGNPLQRNYTGDLAAQAVSFACLDYSGALLHKPKSYQTKIAPMASVRKSISPPAGTARILILPTIDPICLTLWAVLTIMVVVLPRTLFISSLYSMRSSIRPICLRMIGMETHNRLSFLMVILQDMDSMVIL